MISKQSAGYFREKAVLGLSALSGDDIDKAIIKTTSHVLKAPKEKYMQSLLAVSFGYTRKNTKDGMPVNIYIVRELEKRTHSHNWIVVEKALVVLHRFLAEASESMVQIICSNKQLFGTYNLKHLGKTLEGGLQQRFMEQYMQYMEVRCDMQNAIAYRNRIETAEFDAYVESLDEVELSRVYQALLSAMQALVSIEYVEMIVNNFCTMEAYELILRDSKMLFKPLTTRLAFILNRFESLPTPSKNTWFLLIQKYDQMLRNLITMMNSMRNSSRVFSADIPALRPLPSNIIDRLDDIMSSVNGTAPEKCTLESLGISSASSKPTKEEKRKPKEEELPASQSRPPPAKPVPELNMEDLFISSPQPAAPQPASSNVAPTNPPFDPFAFDNTNSTPVPANAYDEKDTAKSSYQGFGNWDSGAPTTTNPANTTPAYDAWSTGAPVADPAPPTKTNASVFYQPQPAPTQQPAPLSQDQQPAVTHPTKKADPFQALFNESQQRWQ